MTHSKFFFIPLLLMTALTQSWSASAVEVHGQLSVKNGVVVNKNGVPPQLSGMSLFWSQWMGKYWTAEVVDWLSQDWKITLIRAAVGIDTYDKKSPGYLQKPDEHKNLLKTVIDAAIANGIYVIIDWHSHKATGQTAEAKAFFTELAQTYGKTPNVLFEIFNEPTKHSWGEIKNYSEEVSKTIRGHSENLIIVGTPQWDQRVDEAAKSPIENISNIAYAFHFYASDKWHQDNLRKYADEALSKKLPLFVTEWGVSESNGDGKFDQGKTDTWMKWMSDNKLSWANWSIADKAETSAALKKGASAKGNWDSGDISASGAYVRDKLLTFNKNIEPGPKTTSRSTPKAMAFPKITFRERMLYVRNARPSGYAIHLSNGRLIFNAASATHPVSKVDLSGWPDGMYLLRFGDGMNKSRMFILRN